jgi:hypothetical protein
MMGGDENDKGEENNEKDQTLMPCLMPDAIDLMLMAMPQPHPLSVLMPMANNDNNELAA